MLKEAHFTPQRMLSMLGLKAGLPRSLCVDSRSERAQRTCLLKLLEDPQKNFTFLDYEMHSGSLDGKRVTVGNGGRYAPDTAITTEILCGAGAAGADPRRQLRLAAGKRQDRRSGDRHRARCAATAPRATMWRRIFPRSRTAEIVDALKKAADSLNVRYHLGWIFTTDALFQETPELIQQLNEQNISSIDMVTSTFLTIAQVRGKKAGAVLAVSDECLHGKFGFRDPQFFEAEKKTIEVARKALQYL